MVQKLKNDKNRDDSLLFSWAQIFKPLGLNFRRDYKLTLLFFTFAQRKAKSTVKVTHCRQTCRRSWLLPRARDQFTI